MKPLTSGSPAPPIPGADLSDGPKVVLFYKVSCPTCQMAAPVAERLHASFPGRLVAVGQDPADRLQSFAEEYGLSFGATPDDPPYELSNAYGLRTVPSLYVVDGGAVTDVVESWDRDGWNRVAAKLGAATGTPGESLSWEGDGLPPFRPG